MTTVKVFSGVRTLSADEVRSLKDVPPDPLEKQRALDALWNCMSVAEADALEARINAFAEREDDGDYDEP